MYDARASFAWIGPSLRLCETWREMFICKTLGPCAPRNPASRISGLPCVQLHNNSISDTPSPTSTAAHKTQPLHTSTHGNPTSARTADGHNQKRSRSHPDIFPTKTRITTRSRQRHNLHNVYPTGRSTQRARAAPTRPSIYRQYRPQPSRGAAQYRMDVTAAGDALDGPGGADARITR